MRFNTYSKKNFDESVLKIKNEADVYKRSQRINSIRQWLDWLSEKRYITPEVYTSHLAEIIELEKQLTDKDSRKSENAGITKYESRKLIWITLGIVLLFSVFNLYILYKGGNVAQIRNESAQGRVLPFKGTIEITTGEPLDSKRDVIFRIYSTPTGGSVIYSGACLGESGIQPQFNGNFSILVGSDCGMKPIPESLFNDNNVLYLGVTIGSGKELEPRYQIYTTTYTKDASKLQGLGVGGDVSSIPYIDEKGNMQLKVDSPVISSSQGKFTVQGNILSLKTTEAVNGNIYLQPAEQSNVIIENGRLGIGDFTPKHLLTVESNQPFSSIGSIRNLSLQDDDTTSALKLGLGVPDEGVSTSFIEFFAEATTDSEGIKVGDIRINNKGVAYETSGADFAEYFNITYIGEITEGTIISLSEKGVRPALPDEKIVGAVTNSAGFVGNTKASATGVLVALVGQVDVLVSTLHGDIKAGDRIGASDMPGIGTKVRRENYSVGYALEAIDKASFSNDQCPVKYRKMKELSGKRVRCGTIKVLIDAD